MKRAGRQNTKNDRGRIRSMNEKHAHAKLGPLSPAPSSRPPPPRGKAAGTIARCDADCRASSVLAHEHCECPRGRASGRKSGCLPREWAHGRDCRCCSSHAPPRPRTPLARLRRPLHPACCVSQSELSTAGPSPRFPLDWEWQLRPSWSLVKFAMSWICAMLDFLFALRWSKCNRKTMNLC
jgi:hypothetical protein